MTLQFLFVKIYIVPDIKIFSEMKGAENNKRLVLPSYCHIYRTLCRVRYFILRGAAMSTRVAVMSIIVEKSEHTQEINSILHGYCEYVIGRMGIPYREKNINIISIALDAPQDTISALSGKLGKLNGVSVKTAYSGIVFDE